jgi:putative membrane protein
MGLAAEAAGTLTGFPFGRYEYTGAWWPTVPIGDEARLSLPVGLAWAMVTGAAHCLVPASLGVWARAFVVGLAAALADLAIEPVMAGEAGYWRWVEQGPLPGGAPVSNFFGWWGVASVCGLVLARGCPDGGSPGTGWSVLAGFGAVLASIAGWG